MANEMLQWRRSVPDNNGVAQSFDLYDIRTNEVVAPSVRAAAIAAAQPNDLQSLGDLVSGLQDSCRVLSQGRWDPSVDAAVNVLVAIQAVVG